MSENVEGIRGVYRRLTPVEVGMIVRLYRHTHEMKRAALAAQAHVSDKTLERLESGVPVRADSYRRVAAALGLEEDTFVKDEYIPTPDEYLEKQEREQANFHNSHTKVSVAPLTDPRQLLAMFGSHSSIADDHKVAVEDLELVASFKENFRDWSDIASELAETARLEAAKSLLEEARIIDRVGYVVSVGMTDRYSISGAKVNMSILVFFPRPTRSGERLPDEVWLPKKMGMGL
jgi:transcriptional regulator with XRE-family HTH domain